MSNPGGEKTEKPTQYRMQKAREEGQVARSTDLNGAVTLGAATLVFGFAGAYFYDNLYSLLARLLSYVSRQPLTTASFIEIYQSAIQSTLLVLMPFLIGISAMAILINLIQVKPMVTLKPLMPNLSKINPVEGVKRLFSMRSAVESAKALIKMAVIGGCGTTIILSHQQDLLSLGQVEFSLAVAFIVKMLGQIMLWSVIWLFVMGLIDWRYQAYELEKRLRMSRQDIKDERKNLDGDPMIKGRMRQLGVQMVRKRQLQAVPTADVIITNPTHFSVAIKYDPDVFPAPHVVAKGQDHFAMKIREVAKEHGIPMVENRPIAQSLYKLVDVNHMIPPDLFVAVAEILAYVFSRKKGRKMNRKGTTR